MPASEGRRHYRRYGLALLYAAAALLVRFALNPVLGERFPNTTIFIAVLLAARFLGPGPSVLLTVVGAFAASYLFLRENWLPTQDSLGFSLYFIACSAAIAMIDLQQRARRAAEESARLSGRQLQTILEQISEREQQEHFSAQLRAIVESSDDAIISEDLDGRIQSWNAAAERIFGYKAAKAIGQPMSMLLPAERAGEAKDIIEHIRRGRSFQHFETTLR
ncbi:MAG TPA: PAS domain S-box protein, partial [Bryobacteraceae bacterium]|nr:PAS domain S-box protein [Bryobacteraceae bacterium]